MRAFAMTRGRTRDYAFVGASPGSTWWAAYGAHTSFERPTLLVEAAAPRKGSRWVRAYLSAIPSRRRDRVGTAIRWTVVLESADPMPAWVAGVVAVWLEDAAAIGAALDRELPEDPSEGAAPADAEERIVRALQGAASTPPAPVAPAPFLGARSSRACRDALACCAAALLGGDAQGKALVLNLADAGAAADLADAATLAVLVDDHDEALDAPRPLGKKKARSRTRGLLIGVAVLLVNLAAAAAWLSRSW